MDAYEAALAADKAWSAELRRIFGRDSGDARYDGRGISTPTLKALNAEMHRTRSIWREEA